MEPDAAERVKSFTPTKYELLQLVKFWHKAILEGEWRFFAWDCTGSIEWSQSDLAKERIASVAKAIGQADVDKAIAEARAEFSETVNPRHWKAFVSGNREQWEAVRKENQRDSFMPRTKPRLVVVHKL